MHGTNASAPARRSAFTLLELIVVITIIGILGTIVTIKVLPVLGVAHDTKTKADLKQMANVAKQIYTLTGVWPASISDLVNPKTKDGVSLPGLDEFPKDSWGRDYIYEIHDDGPVLRCLGRDGLEDGEGEDADTVWPPPVRS